MDNNTAAQKAAEQKPVAEKKPAVKKPAAPKQGVKTSTVIESDSAKAEAERLRLQAAVPPVVDNTQLQQNLAPKTEVSDTVSGTIKETTVVRETAGVGTENPLLDATILHNPSTPVEDLPAPKTETVTEPLPGQEQAMTSKKIDRDISADTAMQTTSVSPEIEEQMKPYLEAYPDVKKFYITSDKQVFLQENKRYAFDYQKKLASTDKVTVYVRS